MVDPSRPVAPYLPPEIISRILQFFHPRPTALSNRPEEEPEEHLDFSPISRINMSWRFEAQKRLLQVIYIKSTTKLRKLVDIKNSGLMKHILCLTITLPDRDNFNPDSIFHLIQFSTNLKNMNLILPSTFNFDPTQIDTMKRNDLLSHLFNLKIYFYPKSSNSNKINIVDSILSTSSTLATLRFESGVGGSAFVYGLKNFRSLSLLSTLEIENTLTEELMELLPTSISHLKAGGLAEYLPLSEWSSFSNLKVLLLPRLPRDFHISQLPSLSSLKILNAEKEAILQSLEGVEIGEVNFKEMALGAPGKAISSPISLFNRQNFVAELSQAEEIKVRCEELVIKLVDCPSNEDRARESSISSNRVNFDNWITTQNSWTRHGEYEGGSLDSDGSPIHVIEERTGAENDYQPEFHRLFGRD